MIFIYIIKPFLKMNFPWNVWSSVSRPSTELKLRKMRLVSLFLIKILTRTNLSNTFKEDFILHYNKRVYWCYCFRFGDTYSALPSGALVGNGLGVLILLFSMLVGFLLFKQPWSITTTTTTTTTTIFKQPWSITVHRVRGPFRKTFRAAERYVWTGVVVSLTFTQCTPASQPQASNHIYLGHLGWAPYHAWGELKIQICLSWILLGYRFFFWKHCLGLWFSAPWFAWGCEAGMFELTLCWVNSSPVFCTRFLFCFWHCCLFLDALIVSLVIIYVFYVLCFLTPIKHLACQNLSLRRVNLDLMRKRW